MSELKACPFCGQEHEIEEATDIHWGMCKGIVCGYKVLRQAFSDKELEAMIQFWNTRPLEDALQAKLDRLEKACDEMIDYCRRNEHNFQHEKFHDYLMGLVMAIIDNHAEAK